MKKSEWKRKIALLGMALLLSGCAAGPGNEGTEADAGNVVETAGAVETTDPVSLAEDGTKEEPISVFAARESEKETSVTDEATKEEENLKEGQKVLGAEAIPDENGVMVVNEIVDEELALLGEDSAEGTYHLELKNSLGSGISAFMVRADGEKGFSENFLEEEEDFAAREARTLCLPAATEGTLYDIELVLTSDEAYLVTDVPLLEMVEATLSLKDGEAYLLYRQEEDGALISSLDGSEVAVKTQTATSGKKDQSSSGSGTASAGNAGGGQSMGATQAPVQVVVPPELKPEVPSGGNNVDRGCIGDEGLVY